MTMSATTYAPGTLVLVPAVRRDVKQANVRDLAARRARVVSDNGDSVTVTAPRDGRETVSKAAVREVYPR